MECKENPFWYKKILDLLHLQTIDFIEKLKVEEITESEFLISYNFFLYIYREIF